MYFCLECDQPKREDISPPEEINGEPVCDECLPHVEVEEE